MSQSEGNTLQLNTFGGLSIVAPDGGAPSGAATQRRRLALLAVVAAAGEAGVTREKLISLFWPDLEEERARAALAQAVYALRKATGLDDVVLGTTTLRLNESVMTSDVGQFRKAIATRGWADAAAAWTGPFLDGVTIPGADEFERWVETERGALLQEVVGVFERLAREAEAAGEWTTAVKWWQRRVAADPLAAAGTIGLMEALVAAGDQTGALRHARVYEALVEQQLELPADPAVRALTEKIRSGDLSSNAAARARRTGPEVLGEAVAATAPDVAVPGEDRGEVRTRDASSPQNDRKSPRRAAAGWGLAAATIGVVLLGILVLAVFRPGRSDSPAGSPVGRVLAVGGFGTFGDDLRPAARALTDMLATNLAQVPGLNVLSSVRIYELAAGIEGDTTRALIAAARLAGASEVIDGSVYSVPGGVRLDLRRTDLVSGEVAQALSVTGPDVFSAVDQATTRLLEGLVGAATTRPLADVTTSSLVAYRLYVEGLRAFYDGDRAGAYRLFASALREDSTFAMAAYYAALSGEGSRSQMLERLQRAVRLAEGAGDRENLLIRWHWANEMDDPSRALLAETLVTRYAAEPFAHLHYGRALVAQGRYAEALAAFRRAIVLDRGGESGLVPGRCTACEARGEIIHVLRGLDSLNAAEREARNAIRVEGSPGAWMALAEVFTVMGRAADADDVYERVGEMTTQFDLPRARAIAGIRHGRFEEVDAELLQRLRSGNVYTRSDAEWWLAFSYRAQGRLADAAEVARTLRGRDSTWGQPSAAPYLATVAAAVWYEQGRYRQAAALWDSIAQLRTPGENASRLGRHRVWFMTLAATGWAAAGDTAGLALRADTIEAAGRQSAFIRDQRLHHHVRGLLYQVRGRHEEAVEAFERARLMPTVGYGRTVQAMARSLAVLGRHDEAIAALRPFLAGPIDGSNTYLPLTEIHEQLAELYWAVGRRDSAALHASRVVDAWRRADAQFEARRRRMEDIIRP